ncbi:MAG: EAL domain-containing protein [Pseudomonadota bacterium]
MINRFSPVSLPRAFAVLVGASLVVAVLASSAAVWLTVRPFLSELQAEAVTAQASDRANLVEDWLGDHVQLLAYLNAHPEVISLAIGNVVDGSSLRRFVRRAMTTPDVQRVTLYDALLESVFVEDLAADQPPAVPPAKPTLAAVLEGERATTIAVGPNTGSGDVVSVQIIEPVYREGFVEAALVADLTLDLQALLPPSPLIADAALLTTPPGPAQSTDGLVFAQVGAFDVWLALRAAPGQVAGLGEQLITRVAATVGAALLLTFGLLALAGLWSIVGPHVALQRSEEALRLQKQQLEELAAIARNAQDAICVIDLDLAISWVNPSFEKLTGRRAGDLIDRNPGLLLRGPETDADAAEMLDTAMAGCEPAAVDIVNYDAEGTPYWAHVTITPLFDMSGRHYGFVSVARDITERKRQHAALLKLNEEIAHRANHDSLTDLPNRSAIDAALDARLEEDDPNVTLVRIDLDHFKYVNDTLGHDAGDHVLCVVADVLRNETAPGQLPARVGGDEFAVLMAAYETSQEAQELAERLLARIRQPVLYAGRPVRFGASFGVASSRDGLLRPEEVALGADAALYEAKALGRNTVQLYTPALHTHAAKNRDLATELRSAVETGAFVPHFQPQFDAKTGALVGVETLARWPTAAHGLLGPEAFLRLAEQMSLLTEIDAILFRKALGGIGGLADEGIHIPKVSFNLTPGQILTHDLPRSIADAAVPGVTIALEVADPLADEGAPSRRFHVDTLREMGVELVVDDFGAGAASILGLHGVNPDAVKIDRRLVLPLTANAAYERLVRATIATGRALGATVIASGVETEVHAKILAEAGVDTLQGYHFARPMPLDELAELAAGVKVRDAG